MANKKYTEKLARKVIKFYCGGKCFIEIAKMPGMPSAWTLSAWRKKYPWYDLEIFNADELYAKSLVAEARRVLRSCTIGGARKAEALAKHLQWESSKVFRRLYGDKIDIDVKQKIDISSVLRLANERIKKFGISDSGFMLEADITPPDLTDEEGEPNEN